MNMTLGQTPHQQATHPWILGTLAVYASDLQVARQVHDLVISRTQPQAFGTVTLDGGDEVDWVDMSYHAMCRNGGR